MTLRGSMAALVRTILVGMMALALVGGPTAHSVKWVDPEFSPLALEASDAGGVCLYINGSQPESKLIPYPVPDNVPGGDIPPVRSIVDFYPTFNGIAVD